MQPDDIQGLEVEGTKDAFDDWWEIEHEADDVDYDLMDDED